MSKSFTVIIPTFNNAKYLEKCIDSVLNQNYEQDLIQILVIDDGSTDNTSEIMKKYQNEKYVEYHIKKNGQWGSVINFAKNNKLIKNEFVSILDADDFLDQNAYKLISKKIKEEDLFVGSFKKFNGQKTKMKISPYWFLFQRKFKNKRRANSPFCLPLIYFVKSKIFYQIKDLEEGVPYQDINLISQFVYRANNIRFTSKVLGYYYFNRPGNSMSAKWNEKRVNEELLACYKAIENDAQEIVAFRLSQSGFQKALKGKNIKFNIKRKMNFAWFPWYIRMLYFFYYHFCIRKFFNND